MAENIYSKGTRVWFTDKDQGWISAEVTNVVRSPGDAIKLTFVDDRGKVSDCYAPLFWSPLTPVDSNCNSRKSPSTQIPKRSETAKMICHLYETLPY
jgi:hypothetical protein